MSHPGGMVQRMGLAVPQRLSPSSVSAFKDCPLAFRFSYIDRLPEPPSAPASKGTLVHRALERLMCRPPAERTIATALDELAIARVEMADDPDLTGLELTDDEWEAFHADAEVLVRRYFELEDPTTVRPIGLELKLSAEVGRITLRGVIDRLELDADGELVVTDYKTGSVPSEMYENTRLAGVHIYAFLCERMLGRLPAKVQLYFLSKPEAIIARPSAQSVGGVERKTGAVWNAIARACERDDFRPHPGPLCNYCTFRPYCPAHGGDPTQAVELRGPGRMIESELPLAPAVAGH
jgi:putative RecB family exonuclease